MRINKYLFIWETSLTSKLLLDVCIHFLLSFSIIFKKNGFAFFMKNILTKVMRSWKICEFKNTYILLFSICSTIDILWILVIVIRVRLNIRQFWDPYTIHCIRYLKNAVQCRENISTVKKSIDLSSARYISTRVLR